MMPTYTFITGFIALFLFSTVPVVAQEPTLKPFDTTIPSGKSTKTKTGSIKSDYIKKPRVRNYLGRHYIALDGGWGFTRGQEYEEFDHYRKVYDTRKNRGSSFGALYSAYYLRSDDHRLGGSVGLRYVGTLGKGDKYSYNEAVLGFSGVHYVGPEAGFSAMLGPVHSYTGFGYGYMHARGTGYKPGEHLTLDGIGLHLNTGLDFRLTQRMGIGVSIHYLFGFFDLPEEYIEYEINQFNILVGVRFFLGK